MDIKLSQDLSVIITDRLGAKVHEQKFDIKDFRKDEWHEFDYKGRSFELQTYDNGENLHVAMYNYGDTEHPSDSIANTSIKDSYEA